MRKLILTLCLALLTGILLLMNANSSENVATLSYANIEALADTESNKNLCVGIGSLDCPESEYKVKFIRF
jgi:hypothetical protein